MTAWRRAWLAGHINECGAQCSGGNCLIDWWTIPDMADVGFPIIEAEPSGEFVVTKHGGTGGRVDPEPPSPSRSCTRWGDPQHVHHAGRDRGLHHDPSELEEVSDDRVRVHGVKGRDADATSLKVSIAYSDGWKAVGTLVYAWPDAAAKATGGGPDPAPAHWTGSACEFDTVRTELVGWDSTHGAAGGRRRRPTCPEVQLRIGVRGQRPGFTWSASPGRSRPWC